jgi:hypothetical protein
MHLVILVSSFALIHAARSFKHLETRHETNYETELETGSELIHRRHLAA